MGVTSPVATAPGVPAPRGLFPCGRNGDNPLFPGKRNVGSDSYVRPLDNKSPQIADEKSTGANLWTNPLFYALVLVHGLVPNRTEARRCRCRRGQLDRAEGRYKRARAIHGMEKEGKTGTSHSCRVHRALSKWLTAIGVEIPLVPGDLPLALRLPRNLLGELPRVYLGSRYVHREFDQVNVRMVGDLVNTLDGDL
jgi:hypothetical protein